MALSTPVVFLIFKRPQVTRRVFERIAQARPQTLLVIGDGARPWQAGEAERVAQTRAIIERVDWPCDVRHNFSDVNLGLKARVVSGLEWVFRSFEQAIILEDDCLPDPTFFDFCQELLTRYRDDHRIAGISGNNFQNGRVRTPYSYYFSKYFHCWGWASWRRTWKRFDAAMNSWPAFRAGGHLQLLADVRNESQYWERRFETAYRGEIDAWSYAWQYACWKDFGLTILPEKNLVSNIGFDDEATHTRKISRLANLPTEPIPLVQHPPFLVRHTEADVFTHRRVVEKPRFVRKWTRSVLKRLPWYSEIHHPRHETPSPSGRGA